MSEEIYPPEPQQANLVWSHDIRELEGRMLTVVDAALSDPEQRKATKDLARQSIRLWRRGLPELESEGLESPNFKIVPR